MAGRAARRTPADLREAAAGLMRRRGVGWAVDRSRAALSSPTGPSDGGAQAVPQPPRATGQDASGDAALSLPLNPPSQAEALAEPAAVAAWIRSWQAEAERACVVVEWEERRWPSLGRQRLPVRAGATGAEDIARVAGRLGELRELTRRAGLLRRAAASEADDGAIEEALGSALREVGELSSADLDCLVALLAWIAHHDVRGLYLREIPVPGLHTKWLERHQRVVGRLLPLVRPRAADTGADGAGTDVDGQIADAEGTGMSTRGTQLVRRLGLRFPPPRVRVRLLDPGLLPGVPRDLAAPVDELSGLWPGGEGPTAAIIVENLATFLALPPRHGAVAIWGHGHSVGELRSLAWLPGCERVVYWGDLDADGLIILDRLRGFVPDAVSIGMDDEALSVWEELVVPDPGAEQHRQRPAPRRLAAGEARAWDAVVAGGARLEQERIAWSWAKVRLETALGPAGE